MASILLLHVTLGNRLISGLFFFWMSRLWRVRIEISCETPERIHVTGPSLLRRRGSSPALPVDNMPLVDAAFCVGWYVSDHIRHSWVSLH